jgi:hypothetical protein
VAASRFRLLVGLFTRRFFENDLLAPDIDLRPAAIWLCGALATPSILWTVNQIFRFTFLGAKGYDVLEMATWFDKSLLLMLAMVNAGAVTVLCWEALLVDRRDALILGSLPISRRLVVGAKAAALLRLFGLVAALNLPSVVVFAVLAYSHFGGGMVLRSLYAHGLAVTAASVATSLVLTAALVLVTSLLEGRWLRVMTVVVQVGALVAVTGLVFGVQWADDLAAAARASDPGRLGWMAVWPPAWFLGLQQVLLGAPHGRAVFVELSRPALAAMAAAVVVALPVTIWLWQRGLRVLASAAPGESSGRRWRVIAHAPAWLARRALDRALVQFFLIVLWRSPRHRLAALTALGLAAAVALEGTLVLVARPPGAERWLTEFAVPLLALAGLLAVFRWLLTLPAELPAGWVLGLVTPVAGVVVRRATHRVLLMLVAVPVAALALSLSWWQGSLVSAAAHACVVTLLALAMAEYALARVTFLPFATEYLPGRSNLKARWPTHVVVLLFVVPTLAQIVRALVAAPGTPCVVAVAAGVGAIAWLVRQRGRSVDRLDADPGPGTDWSPVQLRIGWS